MPCLELFGEMAQLYLERVRRFLCRIAPSLVRVPHRGVNIWRILKLSWLSVWGCTSGTGWILEWDLFKAPAEAKAVMFSISVSKIITFLRHMGLFGTDLILVLKTDIHLWIQVVQSGRAAEAREYQNTLASVGKSIKALFWTACENGFSSQRWFYNKDCLKVFSMFGDILV